jgi:hypothetical protein
VYGFVERVNSVWKTLDYVASNKDIVMLYPKLSAATKAKMEEFASDCNLYFIAHYKHLFGVDLTSVVKVKTD